jgi:hypothetical protein
MGWVLGKSSPAVAVEVLHEGTVLRRVALNHFRPDIAKAFPEVSDAENSGFRAMVNVLGLTPEFELFVRAVLKDESRILIGAIRGRRRPLGSNFQPKLQPLMLITLGRSGSTWLMRLLGQHPRIVAYRPFEYEARVSSYWMHVLAALSEPASYLQPVVGLDKSSEQWWLGKDLSSSVKELTEPQIQQWLGQNSIEELASFCQGRIEAFYEQVAMVQEQTEPIYFAEKGLPQILVPNMIWELYPQAREIFLIRDFRDMLCSILAYNSKRGYATFGRERVKDDEEYIRYLRPSAVRLLQSWKQRSGKAYLLHYEDLILRPIETLDTLLNYLELDTRPSTVKGMLQRATALPGLRQHQTSPDPDRSIGRWRRDLDPSLQATCQEVLGDVLEALGYTE